MAVSKFDATLLDLAVKRRSASNWRLADLRFRRADGKETTIHAAVVTPEVGAALAPGLTGRFFFYQAIDHKGLHAIRPAGGALVAGFPSTHETLMAVLVAINVVWVGAMAMLDDRIPIFGLFLIAFTGALFFLYRATRKQAEAQLAGEDGG